MATATLTAPESPDTEWDFTDLPNHPLDYTPEQRERCVAYLATLPLKELRRRQDLTDQQMRMAFDQGNERALTALAENSTMYATAVLRQCFAEVTA